MNNKFGIYDNSFILILEIIGSFPEVEEARIFGSRALGNFKKGSDIDIAIIGEDISSNTIISLTNKLDELGNTPYFFDVINYHTISNKELQKHIDQYGIPIYMKKKAHSN